jgi:putative hydrolase of the HAD superfamily
MVRRHVGWQIEHLQGCGVLQRDRDNADSVRVRHLEDDVVMEFVDGVRQTARAAVPLLAELRSRGFLLGVVSNGCGNVAVLCDDLGYAPFLSLIIDSRRVGLYKPDPAIYRCAAACLSLQPSSIMMIGDSFDRDIRPAASIGMRTAWVQGTKGRACPEPTIVDICVTRLAELPAALQGRAQTVA